MSSHEGRGELSASTHTDLENPGSGLYESEFWGIWGQEAIAGSAEQLLAGTELTAVAASWSPLGATFADTARWADRIKRRRSRPEDDPDTRISLQDDRTAIFA